MNIEMALEKWIGYLKNVRKLSNNTVVSYEADMKKFVKFCNNNNKSNVQELKVIDAHEFIELMSADLSPNSINRMIVSIREMWCYLQVLELVDTNIAEGVKRQKVQQKVPKSLELADAEDMIKKAESDSIRNGLIIKSLLLLGLRIDELRIIKTSDISNGKVLVHGKGSKDRLLDVPVQLQQSIDKYNEYKLNKGIESEYLLVSNMANSISKRQLQHIVTKYIKDYDEDFVTHTTRKTFCSLLYNNSHVDIATCQQLLNHQSIATTMRYLNISSETKKNAINSNPLLR